MKTVYIAAPKACQIPGCDKQADYDAPTVYGPWANLCDDHLESEGATGAHSVGFHFIVGVEPVVTEKEQRAAIKSAIEAGDADLVWDLVGDGDLIDFI